MVEDSKRIAEAQLSGRLSNLEEPASWQLRPKEACLIEGRSHVQKHDRKGQVG